MENYLQQNSGIALEDAEDNAYAELRKDYRLALIVQYQRSREITARSRT